MKTTNGQSPLRYPTLIAAGLLIFLGSCKDNAIDFNSNDSQGVENEATTDGYFQDADDISGVAVLGADETVNGRIDNEGGKSETFPNSIDIRFACATVTVVKSTNPASTLAIPRGTITIDFGAGCTDAKGNVRKGRIIVVYVGRRFSPNSTVTTTLENYYINGVKIEGTRVVTNSSTSAETAPRFTIVTTGGKATWPDASVATREATRTVEWTRGSSPLQDQLSVTGSATGVNRLGNTYSMTITSALIFKRECAISDRVYMPVQGVKELTVDSKKITINYGTGDCDRKVTITVNGKSKDIEVAGT